MFMEPTDSDFPSMMQLVTFTIWMLCAAVSIVGAIWRFQPISADRAAAIPLKQLSIDVSIDPPSASNSTDAEPASLAPTESRPPPPTPPAAPAVAESSPGIAFAIPAAIVARAEIPVTPARVAPAVVHHLVLGQGEAQYIKLDYPEEAQLHGEEGSVGVQFAQDNDGHVTEAHLAHPSRWPILNAAALKAVRQTAFPPGQSGVYDIPFEFKLQ
jgi:protein TonB